MVKKKPETEIIEKCRHCWIKRANSRMRSRVISRSIMRPDIGMLLLMDCAHCGGSRLKRYASTERNFRDMNMDISPIIRPPTSP